MAQLINQPATPSTIRLELSLLGKGFSVQCEEGEESRVEALAGYVDGKLRQLSGGQSSATENRLLMLCCLMLADEIFELRTKLEGKGPSGSTGSDLLTTDAEAVLVAAVEDLNQRLNGLASRLASI